MTNYLAKRLGNYHYGLEQDRVDLVFKRPGKKPRRFIVFIASAYNAFGLIGPEHNGIVVLDDDNKCVVLDRHAEINSGYYGPSESQRLALRSIAAMSWLEFRSFCEGNPRSRFNVLT